MSEPIRTVEIAYYTGTGGTARCAFAVANALRECGASVRVHEIRGKKGDVSGEPMQGDLLVLLYPVYALNAPAAVYRWIAAHPAGSGTPAAVLSVSGGGETYPNRACRVRALRALEKSGYDARYERMLVMPSNIFAPTPDDLALHVLSVLPRRAAQIARDLLGGVRRRTRAPLLDRITAAFGMLEAFGARQIGKGYYALDACTGCGLCEKGCPQGNIELRGGKPNFGGDCALCLHCVYGCPVGAVRNKHKLLARVTLPKGYDLDALERRLKNGDLPPPTSKRDWAMGGVFDYLDEGDSIDRTV